MKRNLIITLIRSATQKLFSPWCLSESPPRTKVRAAERALSAVSAHIVLNWYNEDIQEISSHRIVAANEVLHCFVLLLPKSLQHYIIETKPMKLYACTFHKTYPQTLGMWRTSYSVDKRTSFSYLTLTIPEFISCTRC